VTIVCDNYEIRWFIVQFYEQMMKNDMAEFFEIPFLPKHGSCIDEGLVGMIYGRIYRK
jgi:hypothetical protein